jgi:hypothetical protein
MMRKENLVHGKKKLPASKWEFLLSMHSLLVLSFAGLGSHRNKLKHQFIQATLLKLLDAVAL